ADDRKLQRLFVRRLDRLLWIRFERVGLQSFVELAKAFAMLRRDCHRIAETERIGLVEFCDYLPPLRLVRDQDDRLAATPQPAREMPIQWRQPSPRVDDQNGEI